MVWAVPHLLGGTLPLHKNYTYINTPMYFGNKIVNTVSNQTMAKAHKVDSTSGGLIDMERYTQGRQYVRGTNRHGALHAR